MTLHPSPSSSLSDPRADEANDDRVREALAAFADSFFADTRGRLMRSNPDAIEAAMDAAYGSPAAQPIAQAPILPARAVMRSLADFPAYIPEAKNPDILVRGRWLERGGSAWLISTAGTGKSIFATQLALSFAMGVDFCQLHPMKPLCIWVFQSEDSPSRVTIDREDIIAELSEQRPEVDWRAAAKRVLFLTFPGLTGAEFLTALDETLGHTPVESRPDLIIINPFLAFIGGPVTDGAYVTPFLRGGEINRSRTEGLQCILERHSVGVLIFHHTPKPPPSDKDLESWLKSAFPEYMGAGSSDITNWGRSFLTMMKIPGRTDRVCVTAGKNGSELGWEQIDGAFRHYLAWSRGKSITGGRRHAWRELDEDEMDELMRTAKASVEEDAGKIAAILAEEPQSRAELIKDGKWCGLGSRRRFDAAWEYIYQNLDRLGFESIKVKTGRNPPTIVGRRGEVAKVVAEFERNYENARSGLPLEKDDSNPRRYEGTRRYTKVQSPQENDEGTKVQAPPYKGGYTVPPSVASGTSSKGPTKVQAPSSEFTADNPDAIDPYDEGTEAWA